MKTARLVPIRIGLVCLTLLWACQKDKLPKPTQDGKNTFGCRINGKNWVPNGGVGYSGLKPIAGGFVAMYDEQKKEFRAIEIKAHSRDGRVVGFYLNNTRTGIHDLNQSTAIRPFTFVPKNYGVYYSAEGGQYVTSAQATGQVNVFVADTVTGVISGTFSFRCSNFKDSNDKVEVRNGRFDINVFTLR